MTERLEQLSPRLAARWIALRESFWFLPSLMAAAAILLSQATIEADRGYQLASESSWLLFADSPDGARAMLMTIATSSITVAGVAFSITIVALTLASSQFGPRVLQHFMRDRGNQVVLGTFIAAFLYSLLVLRAVGDNDPFVPNVSITVALLLALGGIVVLIYFLDHAPRSMSATTVVDGIGSDLDAAIRRSFPREEAASRERHGAQFELDRSAARVIRATNEGYLQTVDALALVEQAAAAGIRIEGAHTPGTYVPLHAPLAWVEPTEVCSDEIADTVHDAFLTGAVRTVEQDASFAVEQLVEVALRALSPGVNDPPTATYCIDRLTSALALLATRFDPEVIWCDEDGMARLRAPATSRTQIVERAFDEIRRASRSQVEVTLTLLRQLTFLATLDADADVREALRRQADATFAGADSQALVEIDREALHDQYAEFQSTVSAD